MFQKISSKMDLPSWASGGSRWATLLIRDRLLDGTFYNHLPYAFYEEEDPQGRAILLEQRRPSTQYRLPRYVARWAGRKLFAGRHIPKIRAKKLVDETAVAALLTNTRIWQTMFEAVYRGSVGSVAVSFRVEKDRVGLHVWRAVWCSPVFDDFGELALLRVHYTTTGVQLRAKSLPAEHPEQMYWFIRDYTSQAEITYVPVLVDDWNPATGFREPEAQLVPAVELPHGLNFVPAVWISNPDGVALWEDAIPNMIEIDYLLSQAARGSRYNCAPQLVTVGQLANGNEVTRGPTTYLAFDSARKSAEGETLGGGDAKLLEMTGTGAEAALRVVEQLKKMALEQIGVIHHDPSEIPGPLSGRAMEFLDNDAHDVAMQWRTIYGDGGALPLICKILRVLAPALDVTSLWLQWPRIYQPTPDDLLSIVNALKIASTPTILVPGQPATDVEDKPNGRPSSPGSAPLIAEPLLDLKTARAYLEANMDLGILDDTEDGPAPGPAGSDPIPTTEVSTGLIGSEGPFYHIYKALRI